MDADDRCAPNRLELQSNFLEAHPTVAVLGTAYERCLPDGTPRGTVVPPLTPGEIRWRLLLGNTMCHGSVTMRRGPVLDHGGYDESCLKAQDFELWLRLSAHHDLANLPEVLYSYTIRDRAPVDLPCESQAAVVAVHLLDAWNRLPETTNKPDRAKFEHALAESNLGGERATRAASRIEQLLETRAPTRESIMALMFAYSKASAVSTSVAEACKRSRLREKGRQLRAEHVERVWLWGAGAHTQWLLAHAADLALPVSGIVDDAKAGQVRLGHQIAKPQAIPAGSHVLLSSDRFENLMWERSTPHRARGVIVHRLYADDAPETLDSRAEPREHPTGRVA